MKAIINGVERAVKSIDLTTDPEVLKVKFVNLITEETHAGPAILVEKAVYSYPEKSLPEVAEPTTTAAETPMLWEEYLRYKKSMEPVLVKDAVYRNETVTVPLDPPREQIEVVFITKVQFNKENDTVYK